MQGELVTAEAVLRVVVSEPARGGEIALHCVGVACNYPDRPVNPQQLLQLKVQRVAPSILKTLP